MNIEYDPQHDILNIEFIAEEDIAESIELDGVIIDCSKDRKIVTIGIIDAGVRTTENPFDLISSSIVKKEVIA